MVRIHRSRRTALGIALVLAGALVAPLAVSAQEQALAVVPVAPSWDEISGYRSVEASRAAVSPLIVADPAWDVTSGYGAVERSRASRSAMIALSATSSQVSPDMRWAPADVMAAGRARGQGDLRAADLATARAWDETSGYGPAETSRAAASAWLAGDASWNETSGYGAVEANRLTSRPTPAASITPGRARVAWLSQGRCPSRTGCTRAVPASHAGWASATTAVAPRPR